MAVTYGFYNSLNKDRMYNAEQMSSIFNGIITDGVFSTIGDALMTVAGTGMQVIVKPGRAWFNSTWTLNDAQLPLDVPAADVSLTRIDAVILEVNSAIATRANSIKVLKGTPSANPTKPALSMTETLHQYALAYITVAAGATSITAANIEINVGKTSCPFITSVLQQTDITDLFNQWDAEFSAWFANVQSQLSGDIAANLQRQIDLLKVATGVSVTNETASIIGIPNGSTVDKALAKIGTSVYLIQNECGYIEVKIKDSLGRPVTGVSFDNITDASGNPTESDADGICRGYIKKGSQNIAISKYGDIAEYTEAIEIIAGVSYKKEITISDKNDVLYETSQKIRFSGRVSKFDICAIGGGGGGGSGQFSSTSTAYSGAGGGGGHCENSLENIYHKGEDIEIAIGAGGIGGEERLSYGAGSNGTDGGSTIVKYRGSILVQAGGGKGGDCGRGPAIAHGGAGNGSGGNGVTTNDDSVKGTDATVHKYNDPDLPLAGGGGGDGGDSGQSTGSNSDSLPFGGKTGAGGSTHSGSKYAYWGGAGRGVGGGGAGGNSATRNYEGCGGGGDGHNGGVYARWEATA